MEISYDKYNTHTDLYNECKTGTFNSRNRVWGTDHLLVTPMIDLLDFWVGMYYFLSLLKFWKGWTKVNQIFLVYLFLTVGHPIRELNPLVEEVDPWPFCQTWISSFVGNLPIYSTPVPCFHEAQPVGLSFVSKHLDPPQLLVVILPLAFLIGLGILQPYHTLAWKAIFECTI